MRRFRSRPHRTARPGPPPYRSARACAPLCASTGPLSAPWRGPAQTPRAAAESRPGRRVIGAGAVLLPGQRIVTPALIATEGRGVLAGWTLAAQYWVRLPVAPVAAYWRIADRDDTPAGVGQDEVGRGALSLLARSGMEEAVYEQAGSPPRAIGWRSPLRPTCARGSRVTICPVIKRSAHSDIAAPAEPSAPPAQARSAPQSDALTA